MLVTALAATLIGFGLLVVALVTGTLWLAVACIAVCVLGAVFLLADTVGVGNAVAARRARRRDPPPASVATLGSTPDDVADTEVTTEIPRVDGVEPVVSLDSPDDRWQRDFADSAAAGLVEEPVASGARHGRHGARTDAPHAHEAPAGVPHSHHAHAHEAGADASPPDRPQSVGPHAHSAPGADDTTATDTGSRRTSRHGRPD